MRFKYIRLYGERMGNSLSHDNPKLKLNIHGRGSEEVQLAYGPLISRTWPLMTDRASNDRLHQFVGK